MSGALSSTQKSGSVEVEFRKALRNGRSQPRAVKKAADKRSRGVRAGASDYRRQDGHATGPRLRPWPTQGHVRRYTGLDRNRRWREQLGFRHLSAKGKLRGEGDAAVLTKSVAHFYFILFALHLPLVASFLLLPAVRCTMLFIPFGDNCYQANF